MKHVTAFVTALAVLGFAAAAGACERYKPVVDDQTAGTPVLILPATKAGS